MAKRNEHQNEDNKMEERVLHIRRVSKKTTGGNYISFSALVAVGDGEGNVGIGIGRGLEVPPAIQKAISQAKKNMVRLPIYNDSLPHEVVMKYKSSRLLLKPAPPGTGLKVGGVVRAVLDIAGVNNASGKIIGTRNQITNAYAVIEAIKMFKPRIVAEVEADKENNETDGEKPTKKSSKKEVTQEQVVEAEKNTTTAAESKPKKAAKKVTKTKSESKVATKKAAKKTDK